MKILSIIIILFNINLISYDDFYNIKKEPKQKKIKEFSRKKNGYKLKFLYSFEMEGRVVSSKRYNWDNMSNILTHDIGIVWGKISKTNIFNQFNWNQKNRFLIYSIREDKLKKIGSEKYINSHIANIHLIPKDWYMEKEFNKISPYDIIYIKGYLVDIQSKSKIALTSISRSDSGPGACEIIYVSEFKIIHKSKNNLFYKKHKNKNINTSHMDFNTPGKNTRVYNYFNR
jgi:hypothetical protein